MTTPSPPTCRAPGKSRRSSSRSGLTWSCNSRANVNYETIKHMKDCGLRLFLVGYESGNQEILNRIKKGIQLDEAKQFTKNCKELGVVIHGTFILGLPVETKETIEETIRYAMELDVFSIQVSLAAPYPGTELYDMARQNGWFAKKDKTDIVHDDGLQQSTLEYPGLSKEEIFESVDRFYRAYYLRPQAHPAHHQNDAGRQGRLRAPVARRL